MKRKNTKFEKGGLYIALCCFALVIAAVGYVGKKSSKPKTIDNEKISLTETVPNIEQTQIPDSDKSLTISDNSIASAGSEEKDDQKNEEVSVSSTVEVEDPVLAMPVDGKVITSFSKDSLVFNELLSDWRTHNGIDIECESDSAIYSSADGIVSEIFENAMGKSVKIDHQNGYETVYSNLSDEIAVIQGDSVKTGDLIGKINNDPSSDFTNKIHLHFEVIYNGNYVDPIIYLDV